jgi:MFS family permease
LQESAPLKNNYRWLNSTVLGVGLASLFSDTGHEMATVAMPALIASLGGGSAVLGTIEGVSDGLSSFAKLLSGHYSDRLQHRKPLAVIGYFITASGMASFALATQTWHVLLGRVFGWLGRGVRTPVRNVLLTEATTPETYGRAFGLERMMDSAGAVLGPCLAAFILVRFGIRSVFALTLIPGSLAAIVIWFLVKEKHHEVKTGATFLSNLKLFPQRYKTFLYGVGIAGLGDFSNTLLILWATQAWTSHYGIAKAASLATLFYVGYNVVYTFSSFLAGRLADTFPKHWILGFGYFIAVIPALALCTPGESFLKFAIIFGFSGLYMGFWETVEATSAAALLPPEIRGTGFGVLASVNGVGDLFSSILVGVLWAISAPIAMTWVIFTTLVGAFLILKAGSENEHA